MGWQELDVFVDCRGPALLSALTSYKNENYPICIHVSCLALVDGFYVYNLLKFMLNLIITILIGSSLFY